MKRLLSLLLVLALVRIGFTYLDSSNATSETAKAPINTQEYFFGVKNAESNLNQVLALLVGKSGTPGPVGVAGTNGVIGMNGVNGADGLPGAPGAMGAAGAAGRDGAGVVAVQFTGNQNGCTTGGTKLTDGTGAVTYICNGAPGAPGAAGATGAAGAAGATGATGAAGTGSGGTLGYGQGEVTAGPCEDDGIISINVTKTYTGSDFRLNELTIGKHGVTGDIKDGCAGKTVTLYMKIGTGTLNNPSAGYANGNIIKCTATLPAAAGWPTSTPQFTISSTTSSWVPSPQRGLSCVIQGTTTAVTFSDISTADHTEKFGFEIG
jgi:hypothetical protein